MTVLFIHHSTGGNLIKEGHLREKLEQINPGIELWDHSYNLYPILPRLLAQFTHHKGLSDNKGHITGIDYKITLSNNSPKEYAEIFSRNPNDYTLKSILQYDVIAFKNCFPTTKIISDKQLQEYKKYYETIRDSVAKYKDKKFILLTPPPLRMDLTQKEYATRTQSLIQWLQSDRFLKYTKNLFVFDLFGLFADKEGYLKKEYTRFIPLDSHPNRKANETIAPLIIDYMQKLTK